MQHTLTKKFVGLAIAVASIGGVAVGSAGTASAANGQGRMATDLNYRLGPGEPSRVLGTIPNGTVLTIECTLTNYSVTGPWGPSNLWDRVFWNGQHVFVSDAWVWTGTSAAVAPPCGAAPAPTPVPTPVPTVPTAARAVAWAKSMIGNTSYNGLCEKFVENAYGVFGVPLGYWTALADFNAQKAAGRIHTTANDIPAGALVFFRNRSDGGNGHVEIAVGNGTFITSAAKVQYVNLSWAGTFLGWAPAPTNWPGR